VHDTSAALEFLISKLLFTISEFGSQFLQFEGLNLHVFAAVFSTSYFGFAVFLIFSGSCLPEGPPLFSAGRIAVAFVMFDQGLVVVLQSVSGFSSTCFSSR